MTKTSMNAVLRRRMVATQQASQLQASDDTYQQILRQAFPPVPAQICELPLDRLDSLFTADIDFKLYPPLKLETFAQQLQREDLLTCIIVRCIPDTDRYGILAGHNRVEAARISGQTKTGVEIMEADDIHAITIAAVANLIQRQDLSIMERGKAYKTPLDAKSQQGHRSGLVIGTSDGNRRKYSACALVAEFFGVTEYKTRKVIHLTQLTPELQNILESIPEQPNFACADLIVDYDVESQTVFVDICSIEGYQINKSTVQCIVRTCPPPAVQKQLVLVVWREAWAKGEGKLKVPPKKIIFNREKLAPYLDELDSDQELETLFLAFLQERMKQVIISSKLLASPYREIATSDLITAEHKCFENIKQTHLDRSKY